jgi:hypothetical protein
VPDPMLAEASAEAGAGERSAAPRPKTVTVERREASVPRHSKLPLHGAPYRSTCQGRTHWNPAIISTRLYCVLYGSAPSIRGKVTSD